MERVKNLYANPSQPGSYSGLETFFRALKNKGINVEKKEVKEWLMSQNAYTLHKPLRKKFQRNRVIVSGIDDTWQADLADMSNIKKHNSNFKYIITVIDVFSKFAWAIPIKNKYAKTVIEGFSTIFTSNRRPKNLQTDKGSEFINAGFKKLLSDNQIKLYSVESDKKACVVERFNRTLKEKMYRYFTDKNTYNYINVLDGLMESYNSTYHRTIKMPPVNVSKANEKAIWKRVFGGIDETTIRYNLEIGDKVRISKYKSIFEKGYTANWTDEIFIIQERIARVPPVYRIKDLNDKLINGVFYEKELQKIIKEDAVYKISRIIKTRKKRNGEKEYFVSWLGYPSEFNSWVNEEDISALQQ